MGNLKATRVNTDSLGSLPASGTGPGINGRVGEDELFTAQDQAISVVEQMYLRVIYVLQLQRTEPCSSEHDIQAEIEDTAITSWPHLVPEAFISSLDSGNSLDVPTGLSFTILVHLYLLPTLPDGLWYLGQNFRVEIIKVRTMITELNDPRLSSLMEWPMNVVMHQMAGP